ncbi:hypothetical protein INT47_002206 [Mucor saturninus]|uniref:Uncharacterized protein n=1 Tax=Mucor saturninus TaxID=64648 RepID=A0A8H7R631_9FUNG|nr:hypothetical protein INT47_002206 [Mucor saturninus]
MTDPELPERMAQLEKTIDASNTSKTKYADYSDSQKTLFMYYLQLKLLSAAASTTGQDWAKKLRNDPDFDIFEKNTNKTVRKGSQLQEEYKAHLIEFFDARVSDAVEERTKNFEGFTLKKKNNSS